MCNVYSICCRAFKTIEPWGSFMFNQRKWNPHFFFELHGMRRSTNFNHTHTYASSTFYIMSSGCGYTPLGIRLCCVMWFQYREKKILIHKSTIFAFCFILFDFVTFISNDTNSLSHPYAHNDRKLFFYMLYGIPYIYRDIFFVIIFIL